MREHGVDRKMILGPSAAKHVTLPIDLGVFVCLDRWHTRAKESWSGLPTAAHKNLTTNMAVAHGCEQPQEASWTNPL